MTRVVTESPHKHRPPLLRSSAPLLHHVDAGVELTVDAETTVKVRAGLHNGSRCPDGLYPTVGACVVEPDRRGQCLVLLPHEPLCGSMDVAFGQLAASEVTVRKHALTSNTRMRSRESNRPLSVRARIVGLAVATTFIVAGVPSGVASAGETDQPPTVLEHVQSLQRIADEQGGNRAAGSPGWDASLDYVEAALQQAGYDTTRHDSRSPTSNRPSASPASSRPIRMSDRFAACQYQARRRHPKADTSCL